MSVNDQDAITRSLDIVQEVVAQGAPKHIQTGNPMRHILSATGPADIALGSFVRSLDRIEGIWTG